jgi:hypothetical protein
MKTKTFLFIFLFSSIKVLSQTNIPKSSNPRTSIKTDVKKLKHIENSITIGNLEIMKSDLGVMNWPEAKEKVSKLGNGWRLPKIGDLIILFENIEKIDGLNTTYYWGINEDTESDSENITSWRFNMSNGEQLLDQFEWNTRYGVRVVRTKNN